MCKYLKKKTDVLILAGPQKSEAAPALAQQSVFYRIGHLHEL